ncbi:MAG: thioredoxin family protein [bacterium]|nr:thioredoxin family protein [bacterium]
MMKVIKITALWCSSCLIMNNRWNEILKERNIETINLDYDFDDIEKYNVGDILPVFIFLKDDKEIKRLVGEHSLKELKNVMGEVS